MPRRTLALLTLILSLLSISAIPASLVHAVGYTLFGSTILPDSRKVKFPQVATNAGVVSISGNANEKDAQLWETSNTVIGFPAPVRVGTTDGQADYSTAHVAYAPNGSLYYLWTNANERRIYMSVRLAGSAAFGPTIPVLTSAVFPSHFDVVARSDNTAFLFWRDVFKDTNRNEHAPLRYMIISVSGNVPVPGVEASVDEGVTLSTPRAAAGPNGEIAVGYTLPSGNEGQLQAHIGIWNGTGFILERISLPSRDFADPMPVITPDGKYMAAYRGINTTSDGTYYSERQTDGSWLFLRLYRDHTTWSSLVSDAYGNLHLFWISEASGAPRLYYQVKPSGQAFDSNLFDAEGGPYFNVDGAASISTQIYGHAVLEDFSGSSLETKYFLFGSDLPVVRADSISIDGAQPYTNKASPPVTFTGVFGDQSTMEVRYHWGSPPTSADAFVKFTNPLPVTAPTLAEPSACSTQTLYTQLRIGSAVQITPNQDSITFDKAAQATVSLVNPDSAYDPAFTASPSALLKVDSPDECIGLSGGTASGDITPSPKSLAINANKAYELTLSLAGGEGEKAVTVSVSDLLGNSTGDLQRTITYDATKPVQTAPGTVAVTTSSTSPAANILARIEINGATLTEAGGLYGLIIQNTLKPTAGSQVTGAFVVVPFGAMQNVTQAGGKVSLDLSWSLLSGIPVASQLPGTYSFSAYFVDKAGNRADLAAVQSGSIALAQINRVKTAMPLVRR